MDLDDDHDWQWWCEGCQKVGHRTRRSARRAARQLHEKGLREYRCRRAKGGFHNGHNPRAVQLGLYTRNEWYALPTWQRKQITGSLGR
jgi:hypothetical protein